MKRIKLLVCLTSLIIITSCGSTKIIKKKTLPPLGSDAKVTVYSKIAPTFGYNIICEADVHSKGVFTSTKMSGYESKAKKIARDCGTNIAVIKSLNGFSVGSNSNVTVKILAVKSTTQKSRFADKNELLKKLASAFYIGNISNTSKILTKLNMNKDRKKRAPLDESLLGQMMRIAAEQGRSCPQKSMAYLYKNYKVTIDSFSDFKGEGRYAPTTYVKLRQILSCPSVVVSRSFPQVKDTEKAIVNINNTITESINSGILSKTQRIQFNKIYPSLINEVNKKCKTDSLSSICSTKANFQRIYKMTKK